MTKRYTSINGLLNLLASKEIPFNFRYKKDGKIELEILSNYFIEHSPIVYLSVNINCHELINTLMGAIERECKDGN